jgi:hypothetical protein
MKSLLLLLLILIATIVTGCNTAKTSEIIFNGKDLTGWDTYIGPSLDTAKDKRDSLPQGLNNDPLKVFSVVEEDGQPAIRISGERNGGISTTSEFRNYYLKLEFKWGQKKWGPQPRKRDSGILYHAVGPHGADYGFWMRSQEFQIQEGDCGDYWGVAGGVFDIPSRKLDSVNFVYDPAGTLNTFSQSNPNGRHCIKDPDAEKPSGQWNTIELYCLGDTSVHIVNGKVCMILYKSRQADSQSETPLKAGKIQIQSEGAEVFYRNIQITPIAAIPDPIFANGR